LVADQFGAEGGKQPRAAAIFDRGAVSDHGRFSSEHSKSNEFLHAIVRPLKGRAAAAGHSDAVANRQRCDDIGRVDALLHCCSAACLLVEKYGFLPLNLGWR
jgi:ribosomal protein L18